MSGDAIALAGLRPGSVVSSVYWTVRGATLGLTRAAIDLALPWLPPKSIETALCRLLGSGLIAQPGGRGTAYLVDETCGAQADDVDVLATVSTVLLDMVVDCDAGIAVRVLAGEVGLCDSEVHAALLPALASGQVERFELAAEHGGLAYRPTQHLLAQIAEAVRRGLAACGQAEDVAVVVDMPSADQPGVR